MTLTIERVAEGITHHRRMYAYYGDEPQDGRRRALAPVALLRSAKTGEVDTVHCFELGAVGRAKDDYSTVKHFKLAKFHELTWSGAREARHPQLNRWAIEHADQVGKELTQGMTLVLVRPYLYPHNGPGVDPGLIQRVGELEKMLVLLETTPRSLAQLAEQLHTLQGTAALTEDVDAAIGSAVASLTRKLNEQENWARARMRTPSEELQSVHNAYSKLAESIAHIPPLGNLRYLEDRIIALEKAQRGEASTAAQDTEHVLRQLDTHQHVLRQLDTHVEKAKSTAAAMATRVHELEIATTAIQNNYDTLSDDVDTLETSLASLRQRVADHIAHLSDDVDALETSLASLRQRVAEHITSGGTVRRVIRSLIGGGK